MVVLTICGVGRPKNLKLGKRNQLIMITLFGRTDKPAHSSRPQMAIVMSDLGINTHRGEPVWVQIAQPDYQGRSSY